MIMNEKQVGQRINSKAPIFGDSEAHAPDCLHWKYIKHKVRARVPLLIPTLHIVR